MYVNGTHFPPNSFRNAQLRNNHPASYLVQIPPTDTCSGNVFLVLLKHPNTTCLSGRMERASRQRWPRGEGGSPEGSWEMCPVGIRGPANRPTAALKRKSPTINSSSEHPRKEVPESLAWGHISSLPSPSGLGIHDLSRFTTHTTLTRFSSLLLISSNTLSNPELAAGHAAVCMRFACKSQRIPSQTEPILR